jgi:hypothetical protein
MGMKLKSWHLALLGLILFWVYLILDTIAKDARCNGNYEFGATDCHNEFEALAIISVLIVSIALVFPILLLGVKKEAKKSAVGRRWIGAVFGLSLLSVIYTVSGRITQLHSDEIADILDDASVWFFWEILYISPLILVGWLVISASNRWRQGLGAFLCILIGGIQIVRFVVNPASTILTDTYWQATNMMILLMFSLSYLFAGLLYFLKEREKQESSY